MLLWTYLFLAIAGTASASPTTQGYRVLERNPRAARDFLHNMFETQEIKHVVHIRNATIVGKTVRGVYHPIENGYKSKNHHLVQAYYEQQNQTHDIEKRFTVKVSKDGFEVDVSYIEELTVLGILGTLVCAAIPGCLSTVVAAWSRLAASSAGQAAINVVTHASGSARKRDELQEEYGCVDAGGNVCESPIADAIIKAADTENGNVPRGSYTKVTNPDDGGSLVGYTYFCADVNGCSIGHVGEQPVDGAAEENDTYNRR